MKPVNTPEFPAAKLREYLRYDPDQGNLIWIKRPTGRQGNRISVGNYALNCKDSDGYRYGQFLGHRLNLHRAIWAYHAGQWAPENRVVNHIDHNPDNNRIENLNLLTQAENMNHRKNPAKKVSEITGITWNNTHKVWRAIIRDPKTKRRIHIGQSRNHDEAMRLLRDYYVQREHDPKHLLWIKHAVKAKREAKSLRQALAYEEAISQWLMHLSRPAFRTLLRQEQRRAKGYKTFSTPFSKEPMK